MQITTWILIGMTLCRTEHSDFIFEPCGQDGDYSIREYGTDGHTGKSIVFSGSADWMRSGKDELGHWREMQDLRHIALLNTRITYEQIAYVSQLKQVIDVELSCLAEEYEVLPSAFEPLAQMQWLQRLELPVPASFDLKSFEFIDKLKSLKHLKLNGGPVNIGTLRAISTLRELRELHLPVLIADQRTERLSWRARRIRKLTFHIVSDPEIILNSLSELAELQELNIGVKVLSNREISKLKEIPKLKNLEIYCDQFYIEESGDSIGTLEKLFVSVANAEGFRSESLTQTFPTLRSVSVHTHTPIKLDIFRDHGELEEVEISNCDPQSLISLQTLQKLKRLVLKNPSKTLKEMAKKTLPFVEIVCE